MKPYCPLRTGAAAALTAGGFLVGLFNASLTAFAVGALFAWSRGLLGKVLDATGK